jgi:hypothetical protein
LFECILSKNIIEKGLVDISKARDVLRWRPPLGVDEGLRRVAERYLKRGLSPNSLIPPNSGWSGAVIANEVKQSSSFCGFVCTFLDLAQGAKGKRIDCTFTLREL